MKKELTLTKAMIGFVAPLATILIMVLSGIDITIGLGLAIVVEGAFGAYLGYSWDELEEGAMKGFSRINQTVVIMMLIGILIGVWISAGSVQTMLYYGINLIHPRLFLPLAFIICIITSMMTGTSWGTAGTVGIALIGVAHGLGVPASMAAGAIISGALVGDKLSPLSDTTLLSSAITETNLFDHIISLTHVTLPVSVIALIAYAALGARYGAADASIETVEVLSESLKASCNINIFMIIPLLFVLVASGMRKPSLPVFAAGAIIGVLWAVIFQGHTLIEVVDAAINGFVSTTGNAAIDKLLTRGGLLSMSSTIYLCIEAGILSGIFGVTKVLDKLLESMRGFIKNATRLVFTTSATGALLMFAGAGQTSSLTIPAVAFKEAYDDFEINSAVLSRTLECSGTVLGSIVPWDASALLYTSLFGVSVAEYLPFNFLATLSPIFDVLTVYLGYGVFKKGEQVSLKLFKFERV